MSRRRRTLYTVVAWSIPVGFFFLLEGVLALAGYGDRPALFLPFEPDPRYLQPNGDVIERFFADPDQAPAVRRGRRDCSARSTATDLIPTVARRVSGGTS